jgi:hypothetical protein
VPAPDPANAQRGSPPLVVLAVWDYTDPHP